MKGARAELPDSGVEAVLGALPRTSLRDGLMRTARFPAGESRRGKA